MRFSFTNVLVLASFVLSAVAAPPTTPTPSPSCSPHGKPPSPTGTLSHPHPPKNGTHDHPHGDGAPHCGSPEDGKGPFSQPPHDKNHTGPDAKRAELNTQPLPKTAHPPHSDAPHHHKPHDGHKSDGHAHTRLHTKTIGSQPTPLGP